MALTATERQIVERIEASLVRGEQTFATVVSELSALRSKLEGCDRTHSSRERNIDRELLTVREAVRGQLLDGDDSTREETHGGDETLAVAVPADRKRDRTQALLLFASAVLNLAAGVAIWTLTH